MISSCWGLFHVRLPVWYFGEIGMFLFSNIIFYVPRVGEELLVAFPALCMILATFQSEFLWILYWVFYYGRGNFGWWRFYFHVFLSGLFFFQNSGAILHSLWFQNSRNLSHCQHCQYLLCCFHLNH